MIDFDKLDKISELPVSEELLGAYLEGNLDLNEAALVENMIEDSPTLSEIFDECAIVVDNSCSIPFDECILVDNINFAELDPRGPFTSDEDLDNLDSQQETSELKSFDEIEECFYDDPYDGDDTSGLDEPETNEEVFDLGFDSEPDIEEFSNDSHDVNEDMGNDLDFNSFF